MFHLKSVLSCVDHLDVKPYLPMEKVRILEGLPMMFKTIMGMLLNSAVASEKHRHMSHFISISIKMIIDFFYECCSLPHILLPTLILQ